MTAQKSSLAPHAIINTVQSNQATYHLGDILANAITHGIGAALAIVGAVYLITVAASGSARLIVSCSVFAATLILVYTRWCGRGRGTSFISWTTHPSTC